jgi:copper(I)-binding protein
MFSRSCGYDKAMNRQKLSQYVFAALLFAASLPALAGECKPVFKDGWINLPPAQGARMMLAGYGKIENPCKQAVSVVSASTPAFMHAGLHRSEIADGVERMRKVDELPVAASSSATLEPGGLHLMLMHPSAEVKEGDKVAVTFTLKDGGQFDGEFVVKKAAP